MSLKERVEASPVVFFLGTLLAGFAAGVGTYKAVLEIAQLEVVSAAEMARLRAHAVAGSEPGARQVRVALTHFADVERFASLLRQLGYHVDVAPALPMSSKEDFRVITVGFDVPPPVAMKLIRLARKQMPWVEYVCLQDPPATSTLFLNAHNQWIEARGLRPLTEADFDLLTDTDLSLEEFHRLIASFGR